MIGKISNSKTWSTGHSDLLPEPYHLVKKRLPTPFLASNCYDNAPVESFFSSLKNELVHHRQFQNQAEAQVAITDYIERFYNRQRLHQALGYRSPEEFERQERGA
jgi:transposase InsO family protein